MNELYKHKKTGDLYRLLAFGQDKTHDKGIVVYHPCDSKGSICTRTLPDFFEKFKALDPEAEAK